MHLALASVRGLHFSYALWQTARFLFANIFGEGCFCKPQIDSGGIQKK
jgi:hypothetical protein